MMMQFHTDPYLREASARIVDHTDEGGIVLDSTIFYPKGGGQPGDSGRLEWPGHSFSIATTVKGDGGQSVLVPAEPTALPAIGTYVTQVLDWDRRHKHMRMHTALHLLSVVIPLPVTGGQIETGRGRLDFDMPEPIADPDAIERALNDLVEQDLRVGDDWVSEAFLEAHPELIKTLSVRPPKGSGDIRLVWIGEADNQVDLQPCGGTHVARTSEIGRLRLGKVTNKGKNNRRVSIHLD